MPQLGQHTGGGDNGQSTSIGDRGAHKHHITSIAHGHIFVGHRRRTFFNRHRFAGEGSLLQPKVDALQQSAVSRHRPSGFQQEQIARYQFVCGDLAHLSIATHLDQRHDHLFQRGHCTFGAVLLRKTKGGVEDDDDQDSNGVLDVADEKGDSRGHDENDNHHLGELRSQDTPRASQSSLNQFVGTMLDQAAIGLSLAQPLFGRGIQRLQNLVQRQSPRLLPTFHSDFPLNEICEIG